MRMNSTAKWNANSAQRCLIKIDSKPMKTIVLRNLRTVLTVNNHLSRRYSNLILNNAEQNRGNATSVSNLSCERMNESMKMLTVLRTFRLILGRCKTRNWKRTDRKLNESDFLKRRGLSNLKMQRDENEKKLNWRKGNFKQRNREIKRELMLLINNPNHKSQEQNLLKHFINRLTNPKMWKWANLKRIQQKGSQSQQLHHKRRMSSRKVYINITKQRNLKKRRFP